MLHYGKEAEDNKENIEQLSALNKWYEIIEEYDCDNVYNTDETSFFWNPS